MLFFSVVYFLLQEIVSSAKPPPLEEYLMKYCDRFRHEGIIYGVERDSVDDPRCYAYCIFCVSFKKQYPNARNFEQVFTSHVSSKQHLSQSKQTRITQYFLSTLLFCTTDDFHNTILASCCYGYRPPVLKPTQLNEMECILNQAAWQLLSCLPNNREYPWTIECREVTLNFAETSKFKDAAPFVFNHWLRSKRCVLTVPPGSTDRRPIIGFSCLACCEIPHSREHRRLVRMRAHSNTSSETHLMKRPINSEFVDVISERYQLMTSRTDSLRLDVMNFTKDRARRTRLNPKLLMDQHFEKTCERFEQFIHC